MTRMTKTPLPKDQHRLRRLIALLLAVAGLAAVLVTQQVPNRHRMEGDLARRSEQALRTAGLPRVRVTFTGRDARLRAESPAEAERALGVVRALDGVRDAEAEVPRGPRAPAVPVPPSVVLVRTAGGVSLTGTVPTDDARTALGAAAGALGAGAVDNRLTVDPAVTDTALSGLPDVLRALGRNTEGARVELRGGRLMLAGVVPSETSRAAILAAATGTGAGVVDRLQTPDIRRQLGSLPPVTFPVGGVALTPAARAGLVTAARILAANPSIRIRVEGHTDASGPAAANLALSRARAEAVFAFLIARGVIADRMSTRGYGEARPRFPDTSRANRSANRRVELVVGTDPPPGADQGT